MQATTLQNSWDIIRVVLPGFFTLLGVFLGAWLAFLFQNRREKKKEEADNITAINKALVNLAQQFNSLMILHKDFIAPYTKAKAKFGDDLAISFSIPAIPVRDYSHLKIDSGSLVFLANHGKPKLIIDVMLLEEGFKELMIHVNLRSQLHVSELQPKLEKLGFVEGNPPPMPKDDFLKEIGHPLLISLKRLSDGIEQLTIQAINDHKKIIDDLHTTGKELFPDARILACKAKEQLLQDRDK